jgi:hypothetical protein
MNIHVNFDIHVTGKIPWFGSVKGIVIAEKAAGSTSAASKHDYGSSVHCSGSEIEFYSKFLAMHFENSIKMIECS